MEWSDRKLVCRLTERGIMSLGLKDTMVGDRVFVDGYWFDDKSMIGGDLFLDGFHVKRIGRRLTIGGVDAGLELDS